MKSFELNFQGYIKTGLKTLRFSRKIIYNAELYWKKSLRTEFLTFLSSKYAGIKQYVYIKIGSYDDMAFIDRFMKIDGEYYNPTSGNVPKNQKEWYKTIMQYRYKPEKEFSEAFESPCPRDPHYKWAPDYIEISNKKCPRINYTLIKLTPTIVWLYRDIKVNVRESNLILYCKEKFIKEFNITRNELLSIFFDDTADYKYIKKFNEVV